MAVSKHYQDNELFNPLSVHNRDNCLAPWRALKDKISASGGTCNTLDVCRKSNGKPKIVVFSDIPPAGPKDILGSWFGTVEKWVLLLENNIVSPQNWQMANHEPFDKLFTWNDDLVDNKRYFKLNYAQVFPRNPFARDGNSRTLCTLIAGNKKANHPFELYSERLQAIEWFEKNAPDHFRFYGMSWDRHIFPNRRPFVYLNRIGPLCALLSRRFRTYQGPVKNKIEILSKYRFAICYENATGFPGYITEKIFDCFFAGCVPIYLGAPNIAQHIPQNCFIDKRDFDNYSSLYSHISVLREDKYLEYQESIASFLSGPASFPFTSACFVKTLLHHANA